MTAFLKTNTCPHHEKQGIGSLPFEKNYMLPMRNSGHRNESHEIHALD
jgi:hypothetical protein